MFHHFGTTIAPKQCINPDLIHSQLTPSWESLPSSLNCAHFKRRQWEVKPVRGNPLPGVAPNHALTTAQANLPPSSELWGSGTLSLLLAKAAPQAVQCPMPACHMTYPVHYSRQAAFALRPVLYIHLGQMVSTDLLNQWIKHVCFPKQTMPSYLGWQWLESQEYPK